jgi:GR25 family glycosyltransferase involved in LPS biosynthesis
MFKTFCIAEDKNFKLQQKRFSFDLLQWEPVDVVGSREDARVQTVLSKVKNPYYEDSKKGRAGAAIAHLSLWMHIQNMGVPVLVLEDDAVPLVEELKEKVESILTRLPDGDFYNLFTRRPNPDHELLKDDPEKIQPAYSSPSDYSKKPNVGFVAYVIRPSGAKKLVDRMHTVNLNRHIDWWCSEQTGEHIRMYVQKLKTIFGHDGSIESMRKRLNGF